MNEKTLEYANKNGLQICQYNGNFIVIDKNHFDIENILYQTEYSNINKEDLRNLSIYNQIRRFMSRKIIDTSATSSKSKISQDISATSSKEEHEPTTSIHIRKI